MMYEGLFERWASFLFGVRIWECYLCLSALSSFYLKIVFLTVNKIINLTRTIDLPTTLSLVCFISSWFCLFIITYASRHHIKTNKQDIHILPSIHFYSVFTKHYPSFSPLQFCTNYIAWVLVSFHIGLAAKLIFKLSSSGKKTTFHSRYQNIKISLLIFWSCFLTFALYTIIILFVWTVIEFMSVEESGVYRFGEKDL